MSIPSLNNIFSKNPTIDDGNVDNKNVNGNFNNNTEIQPEECSEKETLLKTIKRQVKQLMEEFVNRKYVHEYSSNVISLCASIETCLLLGLKRRALGLFKESSSLALLEKISKQNAAAKSICTLMSDERMQYCDSMSDASQHSSNTNSSISSKSDYSSNSNFGHSWSASSLLGFNNNKFFSSMNSSSDNEFVNLHLKNLVKHYWIRLALTEKVLDKIIDYLVKNSSRFYNNGSIIGDPCYGYILVSLMSGPCSLEYSRVKNPELISEDPDAGKLIQRQKIQNQSGSIGIEAGKSPNLNHAMSTSSLFWSSGSTQYLNKPSLVNRNRRMTGSDFDESSLSENRSPHSTPRQYVESLHQSANGSLLFGKNNVFCQPREDVNKMPGYLSLHMAINELVIKWTPNELMSGGLSDSTFKENTVKVEWDCALIIWVDKIVYIHCHQQVDKGETLILVNHDGSQNPPFDFPQGGHLMSFLTCLENGLLPKCRLDPPLWLKKNREKLFQKSNENANDGPKSAEFIETADKGNTIFLWSSTERNPLKFSWFQQPFNKKLTLGNRKVLSQPLEHIVFDYRQVSKRNSSSDELLTDLVFRIVRPRNYNHTMSGSQSGDEDFDEFDDTFDNCDFPNDFKPSHQSVPQWHSDYTVWAIKKRCRLSSSEEKKSGKKSSSIRVLCSSMKKEIMARSFYGWLAYSRHMKTIRSHLNQLVLPVNLFLDMNNCAIEAELTPEAWASAFNSNNQIEDHSKILRTVYKKGCNPEIRVQTWPFLLGLYSWSSTEEERKIVLEKWSRRYQVAVSDLMVIETVLEDQENDCFSVTDKNENSCAIEIERKSEDTDAITFSDSISSKTNNGFPETKIVITVKVLNILRQNWIRIEKDVARCDRHFKFFGQTKKGEANLAVLKRIMCIWVWENLELGYIQGMCDLLAPILVIFHGHEELTFACFCKFMERMIPNFPVKDSTKMDLSFSRMRSAVQILDSDLLDHMQSYGDFTHFYFSYRWFLLDFKREFSYKDVFSIWETIWAADAIASPYFSLFVGLALLLSYRDVIIDNAMEFTDIIRFFNEMAERHNAQKVLELARELVEKLQLLLHS